MEELGHMRYRIRYVCVGVIEIFDIWAGLWPVRTPEPAAVLLKLTVHQGAFIVLKKCSYKTSRNEIQIKCWLEYLKYERWQFKYFTCPKYTPEDRRKKENAIYNWDKSKNQTQYMIGIFETRQFFLLGRRIRRSISWQQVCFNLEEIAIASIN